MRRRVASHLAPQPGAFPPAAQAARQVFVSAQLPLDGDGRPVAGDLAAQLAQAIENVRLHLQSAGLGLDAVARLTIYVTVAQTGPTPPSIRSETLAAVDRALIAAFRPPLPACTVVGVAALPLESPVGVDAVAVQY
jgi:enamine deaminase RidA (YjgF/YER057c/UK114 family)